jgi:hypothetical protein
MLALSLSGSSTMICVFLRNIEKTYREDVRQLLDKRDVEIHNTS